MDFFGRSYTMDVRVGHRTIRVRIELKVGAGGFTVTARDPDLTYADGVPKVGIDHEGRLVSVFNRVPPEYLSAIAQVIDLLTMDDHEEVPDAV